MFRKKINNHSMRCLKKHHAGDYIEYPDYLEKNCPVAVFEKENKEWQTGRVRINHDGKRTIDCGEKFYETDQVEVYLDLRYFGR